MNVITSKNLNTEKNKMKKRQLILASSSQPRKSLLERFKIPFTCVNPDVDETPHDNEDPKQLVVRLAKEKALAVSSQYPDALIIGADQVGILDQTILSKPQNHENAIKQLQMMSAKRIKFLIGLCLFDSKIKSEQICLETYDVVFRHLTIQMIENYLQNESALNCAGSFKVEGLGIALVDELQGEDYTALIGLPLIRLRKMLASAGLEIV